MTARSHHQVNRGDSAVWVGAILTATVLLLVHLQLYRVIANTENPAYPQYVTRNFTAASVLFAVLAVPIVVRRIRLSVPGWAWLLVGALSAVASLAPMALHGLGWTEQANFLYSGQRVPQAGAIFVDLGDVLTSVWCTQLGFDVYQPGNGCVEPVIYGPGVLWLERLPTDLRSIPLLAVTGVLTAIVACLAMALVARTSTGLGTIGLLLGVLGAPWLLLLERGNLDALVLAGGVAASLVATRWNRLWSWGVAALIIWILGTWKYYPFVMGVALIPVLRIKYGWTVLVSFATATIAFLAMSWDVFRLSLNGYGGLLSIDDYVVLGRIPVVARMIDAVFPPAGYQVGDALVFLLAVAAFAWGAAFARNLRFHSFRAPMLGAMGGGLFIAAIVLAGFGWAYKSTFVLLCIPVMSLAAAYRNRATTYASLVGIFTAVISALVVWNTVLATLAGVIASAFGFGASLVLLLRRPNVGQATRASATASASLLSA